MRLKFYPHFLSLLASSLLFGLASQLQAQDQAWQRAEKLGAQQLGPPAAFEQNKGQIKSEQEQVLYRYRQGGLQLFMLPDGLSYQFERYEYEPEAEVAPRGKRSPSKRVKSIQTHRLNMRLVGANTQAKVKAEGKSNDYTNYFNVGVSEVYSYNKLTYEEVYPGIDWVIYKQGEQLKYDFIVRPGANPKQIRLAFEGAEALSLQADGSLELKTPMGTVSEQAPISFQEEDIVPSHFKLEGQVLSFELGDYDPKRVLVIDPTLAWTTYFGGSGHDVIRSVVTDAQGNLYVCGETGSANLPSPSNNFQLQGLREGFVAKFDSTGVRTWSTYYGGNGDELLYDLALSPVNNQVYVIGSTDSDSLYGNVTRTLGSNNVVPFLARFDVTTGGYAGSRFLGDTGTIPTSNFGEGTGVKIDQAGNVYFICEYNQNDTEHTWPDSLAFRNRPLGGGSESIVFGKLNAAFVPIWLRYFGNPQGQQRSYALDLDPAGFIYLAGHTDDSTNMNTVGQTGGGLIDAFLAKFDTSGLNLSWSRVYGGDSTDAAFSCVFDTSSNSIYLVGQSNSLTLPTSSGAHQPANAGDTDAFITKFDASNGSLIWGTYYGGLNFDQLWKVVCDNRGRVWVAGGAESSGLSTPDGFQLSVSAVDTMDAVVSVFSPSGNLIWSTYFGAVGVTTEAYTLALGPNGAVYLAGMTSGSGHLGSFGTYNGGEDGFICRINLTSGNPGVLALAQALGGLDASGNPTAWNAQLAARGRDISPATDFSFWYGVNNQNNRLGIDWSDANFRAFGLTSLIDITLDSSGLDSARPNLSNLNQLNLSCSGLRGRLRLRGLYELSALQLDSTGLNSVELPLTDSLRQVSMVGNRRLDQILVEQPGGVINASFPNLEDLQVSGCALQFGDLARLSRRLNLVPVILDLTNSPLRTQIGAGIPSLSQTDSLYLQFRPRGLTLLGNPSGTRAVDSLTSLPIYNDPTSIQQAFEAFGYANQDSIGIGGVRRRPPGDSIRIEVPQRDAYRLPDFVSLDSVDRFVVARRANYTWIYRDATGNDRVMSTVRYSPNGDSSSAVIGDPTIPFILNARPARQTHEDVVLVNIDSLSLNGALISTKVSHDLFPFLAIPTRPKRMSVGFCYDSLNQVVQCQEMLVQLRPGMTEPEKDSLLKDLGMELLETCICNPDLQRWAMSDTITALVLETNGKGTREVTSTSAQTKPELLSATPNYAGTWPGGTNTPSAQVGPTATANPNTQPTLVAFIDAGVDLNHPALRDRLFVNDAETALPTGQDQDGDCAPDNRWGYDFLNNTSFPIDDHGHGTQVAGILSGRTPNNIRPNLQAFDSIALVPLRFSNSRGAGTIFHAACALYHAGQYGQGSGNRIKVINASWGFNGEESDILSRALADIGRQEDLLVVCSAGNNGQNNDNIPHWPSGYAHPSRRDSFKHVISVAAIANPGALNLASYSNFGKESVEIAAVGNDSSLQLNQYASRVAVSGTSFAAPQVSRAAGLLFAQFPNACPNAVKFALLQGVDSLTSTEAEKIRSGGKLNYLKARQILETMNPTERDNCALFTGVLPAQTQTASLGQWQLFPNPAQTQANLRFPQGLEGQVTWKLLSLDGRLLDQGQTQAETAILNLNLSRLPAGLYILELQHAQGIESLKLHKTP